MQKYLRSFSRRTQLQTREICERGECPHLKWKAFECWQWVESCDGHGTTVVHTVIDVCGGLREVCEIGGGREMSNVEVAREERSRPRTVRETADSRNHRCVRSDTEHNRMASLL